MLTHQSGECPVRASTSSAWARPAFPRLPPPAGPISLEGCGGHSWCPSSPWPPPTPACLSCRLLYVVQWRLLPEASLHLQVLPLSLSTAPAPWRTPRRRCSSRATSASVPAIPINTSIKKEACKCCVSLLLVQSPGLVRERGRQALPRLPELPSFQGLQRCRCWQRSLGVSPQELRGQWLSWLSTRVCSYQPSGAQYNRCPWGAGGGTGVSPGWGWSMETWGTDVGGDGSCPGCAGVGTDGPPGADSSTGIWGL